MKKTFIIAVIALASVAATAQPLAPATDCKSKADLQSYLKCKFDNSKADAAIATQEVVDLRSNSAARDLKRADFVQNQHTQSEAPSIGTNSSSMTDKAASSGIASAALNLAGASSTGSSNGGSSTGSMDPSVTISPYAILAAIRGVDPLKPTFYNDHRALRSISFSVGQETVQGKAGSADQKSNVYGAKYLLVNQRELKDKSFTELLNTVLTKLDDTAGIIGRVRAKFVTLYGENAKVSELTPEQEAQVEKWFAIEPESNLRLALDKVATQMQKGLQVSVSFQSKVPQNFGAGCYRAELIIDKGMTNNWNSTTNASFDYMDATTTTRPAKGGRLSEQLDYTVPSAKLPMVVSLAGDGQWMTAISPTYKVQGKLTFPIVKGVSLPISVTYANRTDLIKEKDVVGRFGFTFDLEKLWSGLSKIGQSQ